MPMLCIYCDKEKEDSEFSLEHVIPQFMGGAYSDDIFKINDACRECNNTLGLDVDASYARAWVISAWFQQSSMASFDPSAPHTIPLWCLGDSKLSPPGMTDSEMCEIWMGPLGEQVYWIRPKDNDRYWYAGGNPIKTKSEETRAYFFFTERTKKAPKITRLSFKGAFSGRKKVKKISCTEITGVNPSVFGFTQPDEIDAARIEYFRQHESIREGLGRAEIPFNFGFDTSFMCKLALGIGYCLLGESYLKSKYATELKRGVWFRSWLDEGADRPRVFVGSSLMKTSALLPNQFLEDWGITIYIIPTEAGLVIHLNLGYSHHWTILCAEAHLITQEVIQKLRGGMVQVLHGSLKVGVLVNTSEFLNYKLGHVPHPVLTPVTNRIKASKSYFHDL